MKITLVVDGKTVTPWEVNFATKRVFKMRKLIKSKSELRELFIQFVREFRGVENA